MILSHSVLIACEESISIGSNVQIGEQTSIRDSTHDFKAGGIMMEQPDIRKPITIGNNVWIGKGCLICEGAVIEDGVVVGAHSIVKGILLRDHVYAGAPAKLIRKRNDP